MEGALISTTLVQPVIDAVNNGLEVLVPVGITLMSVMIGVSLIPRIIYKFF